MKNTAYTVINIFLKASKYPCEKGCFFLKGHKKKSTGKIWDDKLVNFTYQMHSEQLMQASFFTFVAREILGFQIPPLNFIFSQKYSEKLF